MQHHLNIDIETKSSVDLKKAGAYRYALSEDFAILLFAYKLDDGETEVIDIASGEEIPEEIVGALNDENVTKHAYNAAFEWFCLNRAGFITPIEQWKCTMIHGLYCGYPAGLEAAGNALGLPQEKKKLMAGKALIKYFCTPCKPTKANGGRTWNLPRHDPQRWELFKSYNRQDVVTEYEILKRLSFFPVPEEEEILWQMDVKMNAFGVGTDAELISAALHIDAVSTEKLTEEAEAITGLANPNSTVQLLDWIKTQLGEEVSNLQKATVKSLLDKTLPDKVRRVLEIRQQLGKTSIKKYVTMNAARCDDGRIRGLMQFYGANRTGRWAGRLVQMQNLPRNYLATLNQARGLVKTGNYEGLKMIYGNVPDTLSQLIRTAFVPSEGRKFVVADFSAIEARVIAWLAGETWVNDVFATHGKIYEATASQMFHVPIEKIAKGNPEYSLRQKGKVATLALGYQGGTAALEAMGALQMGLAQEELPDIVARWRSANPHIENLWYAVGEAAIRTVETAQSNSVNGINFMLEGDLVYGQSFLTIQLPSGRKLYYPCPFLQENRFGRKAVHYYGLGQTKKWGVESTYGGKLTENIVQAIARDCLAETLRRIDSLGLQVVFHVHDEVIIDAPMDITVEQICDLMAVPISWAPGLILKGAGFENDYYMKD